MAKFTVKFKSIKELEKKLDGQTIAKKVIPPLVENYSLGVVRVSKQSAPVDSGFLRNSIGEEKKTDFIRQYFVNANYAAFLEFGTGARVEVPNELKEVAAQFRGPYPGTFDAGLESVKDWCRRNGIDEDAAFPIFMSILRRGIEPRPFIYPALKQEFITFRRDIEQAFKNYQL